VTYAIVEKNLYYLLLFKLLSPVRTQSAVNVLQKPAMPRQNDELSICELGVRIRFFKQSKALPDQVFSWRLYVLHDASSWNQESKTADCLLQHQSHQLTSASEMSTAQDQQYTRKQSIEPFVQNSNTPLLLCANAVILLDQLWKHHRLQAQTFLDPISR
jgi:hypothetical protein